jgi:hypothetical protein
MSRQIKFKINYDEIIGRLKGLLNFKYNSQLAELIELSEEVFSVMKSKGTLLPHLINLALNHKLNLQWLVFGEGAPFAGYSLEGQNLDLIASSSKEYGDPVNIEDLTNKTVEVLKSDTGFSVALAHNINAFHKAISTESRVDILENQMKDQRAQTAELSNLVKSLLEENQKLKKISAAGGVVCQSETDTITPKKPEKI